MILPSGTGTDRGPAPKCFADDGGDPRPSKKETNAKGWWPGTHTHTHTLLLEHTRPEKREAKVSRRLARIVLLIRSSRRRSHGTRRRCDLYVPTSVSQYEVITSYHLNGRPLRTKVSPCLAPQVGRRRRGIGRRSRAEGQDRLGKSLRGSEQKSKHHALQDTCNLCHINNPRP